MTTSAHAPSPGSSRHGHVMSRLQHLGMLAVVRGGSSERVVEACSTLIGSGIDIIEVTYTVPDCAHAIATLKAAHPGAMIGAGTITSIAQLDEAVEAGADFIVTPGTPPDLLSALASCGVPFLPGVLTPTEVMTALAAGAAGVKLFPGSLAGPAGLKALRGPFPNLVVVPTGGVSPDNVSIWLAAGAFAVGAGNDLAPLEAVDSGDQDLIRDRARAWLAVLPERSGDYA